MLMNGTVCIGPHCTVVIPLVVPATFATSHTGVKTMAETADPDPGARSSSGSTVRLKFRVTMSRKVKPWENGTHVIQCPGQGLSAQRTVNHLSELSNRS